MGRPRSCFQIVTCGCDSKDNDEIDVLESNDSKDKRGWSFRKRSSQHRVLNNNVIPETPPPVEKENLETATIDFQSSANSTVPEKPTIVHFTNEETHLPNNIENPKGSNKVDAASENESKVDTDTDTDSKVVKESNVVVIQAGIRGLLAQRDLLELKNVVKVQAAIRGFLVRRHAVGTLRCAQAIVKMQAIVRARRAQPSLEGSAQDEMYKKNEKENPGSKIAVKGEMTKSSLRYISIEKLLGNSFARQLLESTPKNKPINIKCDPSKNDSAWKWLERWMAVSSLEVLEPEKEESVAEQIERETEEPWKGESVTEKMESETEEPKKEESVTQKTESEIEDSKEGKSVTWKMESKTVELKKEESVTEQVQRGVEESHVEHSVDSKAFSGTEDLNSSTITSISPSESEDLLTNDANNFQFQTCHSTSLSVEDNMEQSQPDNARTSEPEETSTMVSSVQDHKLQLEDDAGLQTESNSFSDKPQMDTEQVNRLKRLAPEQLENEGKKFVLGPRKVSNPSFITAQAKFEQLSSAPDSIGTISLMHQDDEIKPHTETISSTTDAVLRTNDPSADETILLPGSRIILVGGSECGTEISISSTLDLPDISEAGVADPHGNEVSKKEVQGPRSDLSTEVEVKGSSTTPLQNDFQPEEGSELNVHSVSSVAVVESAPSESKLERSSSDQQREQEEGDTGHGHRSSPEASPRSHLTVPESQGTPSSQVSTKTKRDKSGSYQKQKSSSAIKKSPPSLNRNSGTRSSTESSYKDQKSGKRRNSFDSARPENVEKELKESSSSNSLPHFMQATQSARAKLQSTNSPISSPDVQDTEIYIKKRHSLPADGRQGSPRVQQPTSRTQQGVKGNDKMWRR